jgi:hypothetical protein
MAASIEETVWDEKIEIDEWTHRVEEFLNAFDGIEFAIRKTRVGGERNARIEAATKALGFFRARLFDL